MAVFRVERTGDYTVMSNFHLKDKRLSLKAKGLLSQMLSLPDDWDYTLSGLSYINRESKDAIRSAVNELETAGYIRRRQTTDASGKFAANEYTIFERPIEGEPMLDKPSSENPITVNPSAVNPLPENPTQLNTKKSNTQKQNTHRSNTDSLPFRETAAAIPPERKGRDAMSVTEIENYRELILENIEYDCLKQRYPLYLDDLNEIVELLVETVCAKRKTTRISGADFPHEIVRSRFLKLDSSHIEFVFDCLSKNTSEMAPFDIREVRELMEDDELELDTIGDEKTALFLIMSDTDTTFNFILAMVQSQLINLLCDRADDKYGGRLPVHVRMILDEFANIGQIPNFDKLIATIRSREISASIILQSQSQLKAIYKDAAEIISDNCDCTLFLSGRGKNAKEISDVLGKETIDSYNQSENRGAQTSHGLNYQKLGKELMSQDEIATMDGGKCILQVRGVRPFFSEKYDITRHPRYKYLSDADKKNYFDVDRYLTALRRKRQRVVSQEETFDLYDIDLSDEDMAAVNE